MDALDAALAAHAANASPVVDPLDAALKAHAASTPASAAAFSPPPSRQAPSLSDTFRNGIWKGAAGFGDMLGNAGVNLANLGIAGYGTAGRLLGGKAEDMPDLIPGDAASGYSKIGHDLGLIDDSKDPIDTAGRFADFGGQIMGGGGLNPAAMARSAAAGSVKPIVSSLATAGASGLGGATGQELTRDTNTGNESLDNLIKALGTFGGGMAVGGMASARGTASNRVAAATKGVTPEEWAAADELARTAAARGAPVTGYEAIQAQTGMNPKMQTQQRVAEQSDAAGGGLTQMMQGRPGANASLAGSAFDAVSPPNNFPDTLAGTLQNAAKGAIKGARDQGNAQAQPFYAKSSNDPSVTIPSSDWNTLSSDPAVAWALDQTKKSPLLGVQNAQPGSLQWLDAAKKFLDSHANAQAQAGDNFPASQASKASGLITSTVDRLNPDYAKARATVADNMRNVVEPMEASQVGKLSRTDDFGQQARALLPTAPADVTPQVVSRTVGTVNAQDPNIMRQFVAQFLRGQYDEASQQNTAGPNVGGGAKFAALVAGNPQQEQNLVSALTSSGANPAQMVEALKIFRAQGMKPGVNSATMSNAQELSAQAGGIGGFLKNPISNTLGILDSWRNGGASSELARALGSGGSTVETLQGLGRVNGAYDPVQQQLLANLLAANPRKNDDYEKYLKAFDGAKTADEKRRLGDEYSNRQANP